MPGRPAAIELSTMPQTRATKNAYWCNRPRNRGLPRSAGFIRNGVGVVVTPSRLRDRRLPTSGEAAHVVRRRRPRAYGLTGTDTVVCRGCDRLNADLGEGFGAWRGDVVSFAPPRCFRHPDRAGSAGADPGRRPRRPP